MKQSGFHLREMKQINKKKSLPSSGTEEFPIFEGKYSPEESGLRYPRGATARGRFLLLFRLLDNKQALLFKTGGKDKL